MSSTEHREGLRSIGLAIIAFGVVVAGLVYGRPILVPLATAILLSNVIDAVIRGFAGIRIAGFQPPRWLAIVLGVATLGGGFYLITSILLGQVDAISAAWPRYVARFEAIIRDLTLWLGPERSAKINAALSGIDLTRRIPGLLSSTSSVVINGLLVLAYIGFLFVERGQVNAKIAAMQPDEARARETSRLLAYRTTSSNTSGTRHSPAC